MEEIDLEIKNIQNEIDIFRMRKHSGLESLLKVDFKRLKGMFDALSFERQKEFLKTFIEKVAIGLAWFEIHYVLPSGMGVDHLLFGDGDDDGNGCGHDGGVNGKRPRRHDAVSSGYKNLNNGNDVSDKNPGENSVSDFSGHDDGAPILGAYGITEKNGGMPTTATKNGKSKNPQETKPISGVANQQPTSHLSIYGKRVEGSPSLHLRILGNVRCRCK